jgi:hypothetical protein
MSELRLVRGDQSEQQKQLKNKQRRQRQRERKSAWKLEQSELENQLIELKDQTTLARTWHQWVSVWLGIAITLTGFAIVSRNAWVQGDNDIDKWIAVSRDLICEAALCVVFSLAIFQWRKGNKPLAGLACLTGLFLGYVALQNFDQWSTVTVANTNQERITNRIQELEGQKGISTLEQRWKDEKRNQEKTELDGSTKCKEIPGGTVCNRYNTKIIPDAKAAVTKAWNDYQRAKSEIMEQAKTEMEPLATKSTQAIGYRKLLPLLGSTLILIGSI